MKDSRRLNDQELEMFEKELKEFFEPLGIDLQFNKTAMASILKLRNQNGNYEWKEYSYYVEIGSGDKVTFTSVLFSADMDLEQEFKKRVWLLGNEYFFDYDRDAESDLGKKLAGFKK